jgi:hypothetical protein
MNVEAPRNMGGLAVYTEVVGGYSTYKTEIVGKAQVRACENCKLMMRHAKIVYHDWYQRGNALWNILDAALVDILLLQDGGHPERNSKFFDVLPLSYLSLMLIQWRSALLRL